MHLYIYAFVHVVAVLVELNKLILIFFQNKDAPYLRRVFHQKANIGARKLLQC